MRQGSDYNRDRTLQKPEEVPAYQEQQPTAQANYNYQAGAQQAPAVEEPPHRIWDVHYTPQFFLDDQQNRKNPDYVSELADWGTESLDAVANYVQGMKDQNPNEWRYGDPGWMSDNPVWTDYIKPLEDAWQEQQRTNQIVQAQRAQENKAEDTIAKDRRLSKATVDSSGADFNKLEAEEKAIYYGTPAAAGTDAENAPAIAKYTQPIMGAVMSSGGLAKVAQYGAMALGLPGVGWITAAVRGLTAGYTYGKSIGKIKGNKAIDKVIELTDILDEKSQQVQGALAYGFEKAGGGDLSNGSNILSNLAFMADNLGDILHYAFGSGKASTEYNPDVVGIVTGMTANMGATTLIGNLGSRLVRSGISAWGGDAFYLDRNEVTRNNLGLSGVYTIDEELMGSNAIPFWLDYGQALYDSGITDKSQLEYEIQSAITRYYGDLSNFSEYLEHELTDPGNVGENMEARAVGQYANITGDKNLAKAAQANTGSWAGDLTANISIIPDVIRGIGKITGHDDWLRTSKGINEVLAQWDIENITNDTADLTARDRRYSGINEDGTINRFTPNANTATNPITRTIEGIRDFFSETNESRAAVEGDAIFDYINIGIEDAIASRGKEDPQTTIQRINKFVDELANPETISKESPFYKSSKSVLFNTVKSDIAEAVRTRRSEITKNIERYASLEKNRQVLNTLSASLNMTPQKLLDMYQNQKAVLTQMILNKANENGGKIKDIDLNVESADFGREVIQMIAPFTGDNAEAWDIRQLGLQMSTSIADGVTDTIINKYGIKPDKFIYRFGDTIKKMQNLILLGLSPSYLANNLVNNVVTRTSLGYGGWMTAKTIGNWMERFGYKPERFSDSLAGEIGQESLNKQSHYDKLTMTIADKKKMKDGLEKVGKFSSDMSKKFGLFGNLSSKVEAMESQQVLASAMMQYMARTWKPGVNFRKMPTQLEVAINAQNPGMVDAIYSAISSGMNMAEIEDALFGTYVAPSVNEAMLTSAKRLGFDKPDDIIMEYFVKNGMMDRLNSALKGKHGDEINDVVEDFKRQLNSVLSIQFKGDTAQRAQAVKNMTSGEGYVQAIEWGYDMTDQMHDIWMESRNANSRIFQRRIEEGMPTKEFREMYQKHQADLTERWRKVYIKQIQTYVGILRGLGIGTENRREFMKAMRSKTNMWDTFYKQTQPQMIQPYLNALEWRNGEKRATWDARVKKAWKDYNNRIEAEVKRIHERDMELQNQMDTAYMKGLKEALGTARAGDVDKVLAPIFKSIRDKRKQITDLTNEIRNKADSKELLSEKGLAWTEKEGQLKTLQTKYTELQHDLYKAIADFNPFATEKSSDPNVDHNENIVNEIIENEADKEQQKAEHDSEVASDMLADGATANQAEAYIKYSPEWLDKLSPEVQSILSDTSKSLKDRALSARKLIQDNAEDKLLSDIPQEIERRLGRSLTTKEENFLYWFLEVRSGNRLKFLPNDVRAQVDRDGFTTVSSYLRGIGILDRETDAEVKRIIDSYKTEMTALEAYTDIKNTYFINRQNLQSIALRAGADEQTADAFSQYFSLIANKWEKNHPGKEFFKDAFGMSNLTVNFKSEKGGKYNATYSLAKRTINVYKDADFFSFVHEFAHGFQYSLDEAQTQELAKYYGMSHEEYIRLRDEFSVDPNTMNLDDKNKWIDANELFVRGFLDYITSNQAPTEGLKGVFETFLNFVREVFGSQNANKWYKRHFANHEESSNYFATADNEFYQQNFSSRFGPEDSWYYWGRADQEHNGTTFRKIFDSILNDDTVEETAEQVEARKEQSQINFNQGGYVPLGDIVLGDIKPSGDRDAEINKFAGELFKMFRKDVYPKDKTNKGNVFAMPTLQDWEKYIYGTGGEDGQPLLSTQQMEHMDFLIASMDDPSLRERIETLREARKTDAPAPKKGVYIASCLSFDYGNYNKESGNPIVAIVYRDGEKVAYVPVNMDSWEVKDGDKTYKVLGVSPESPERWVYVVGNEIRTENERQDIETNPHSPEMQKGSMPDIDPTGDAHNELAFADILPIIDEFVNVYKKSLSDNMSRHMFSNLKDETRESLRGYIERDIRQDLMNTKYKTGKFGEMVRDSALLNYNKRYGFDNFFTLLCPYQFWMTRSVKRWIDRMSSKGGRMWRKYYKLKELEKRNKKEFFPSKISGKFGLYIPGLPDWMGDSIFMSTDQLFVVNQFLEPILNYGKDKNAVIATAEKYLRESFENGDIDYAQYQMAINPDTRENSSVWQEVLAKAQMEDNSDNGIGGLVGTYFGMNLPMSVAKALITGDQSKWNQWPMTRTGTAFRAIVGDNWIGKLGESIMSAPEKALRDASVKTYGNAFAYNEFGAFGDYYLRNQVFDMVTEGKISAKDAVQACAEKDGNPIWEEASKRQRQEVLVKMQGGSVIDASKKLIADIRAGKDKEDSIGADWLYLLASILTAPMSKTVVHEAEKEWRKERGELSEAYDAKAEGDKDALKNYYDTHPNATYNNLRYEDDPEVMLRQFLYKSIVDKYYDLDKAEQQQISMSFGSDFQNYVLNKETRAIESMDLNQLAAYAQALNDKIPYLATDKINTMNVPQIPIMNVPQTTLQQYNTYIQERDTLYPGMSKVNQIYWDLPVEDRKMFIQRNPNLAKYQQWDKQYKTNHPDVKQYSSLISDMYDLREAEDACYLFDAQTLKMLKYWAHVDKMPDEAYKKGIEYVMRQIGTTDSYENFIKGLYKYILGE